MKIVGNLSEKFTQNALRNLVAAGLYNKELAPKLVAGYLSEAIKDLEAAIAAARTERKKLK